MEGANEAFWVWMMIFSVCVYMTLKTTGCKHETKTQGWFNGRPASQTGPNIEATLGERPMFAGWFVNTTPGSGQASFGKEKRCATASADVEC